VTTTTESFRATPAPAGAPAHSPYREDHALGVHAISLEPDPSLIAGDPVDPAAARVLPARACRHFRMIGVAAERGSLLVAMADAGDAMAREVASALAKMPLEIVVAPPDQIDRAIERAFAGGDEIQGPAERAPTPGRLGGILVSRGLVEPAALAAALDTQARSGGRLGEILAQQAGLGEAALCEALADQLRVPLVELEGLEPTPEALALLPEGLQRHGRCLPLETDAQTLYVAVADPLDNATYEAIREHTDLDVRIHMALPSRLDRALRKLHRDEHLRSARAELLARHPSESANRVFSPGQRLLALLVPLAIAAGFVLAPETAAIVLCALAAAITVPVALWWLGTALAGRRAARREGHSGRRLSFSEEEVEAIDERLLPRYTVIVPVFDAAGAVPGLLGSLTSLAYPAHKLEILLVVRPGDRASIEAIESAAPKAANVSVLPFPDSSSGRASAGCNYALQQATGRFVAVLEPGDRPPPAQLKQALLAFEHFGGEAACVQAPLRCEPDRPPGGIGHAIWFGLMVPGIAARDGVLPLGPGGLHLDREALRGSGGWDPFNAAPEAELGIRLHKQGRPAAVVDSPTPTACAASARERAADRARMWRGAMQTDLIEMRDPGAVARAVGARRFGALVLLFGAIPAALATPLLAAAVLLWAGDAAELVEVAVPDPAAALAGGQLVVGVVCFALLSGMAASHAGSGALGAVLAAPLRWVLLSFAAWRGLGQLLRRPFHP
jgi:hypothetical protein